MTLSDHNQEKVRNALAVLVDATPVGAEFDELTDPELGSAGKRPRGVLVFGAAFLVVGLLGGLMLWATRDVGQSNESDVAATQDITWPEWFERTQADAIQVHDSPIVLQGIPGPEPQFDVAALGEEQELTTLTPETEIDWAAFEATGDQAPVVSGMVQGSRHIGYVGVGRFADGSPIPGSPDGPHICTFALDGGLQSIGCVLVDQASDSVVDYGLAAASSGLLEGDPATITIRTPPDASVVAIEAAGRSYWQRPNANMATFTGGFSEHRVDIVIYDSQGNVIYEDSANL